MTTDKTGKPDYLEIAAKNPMLIESLIGDHIANLFNGGHSMEFLASKFDMDRHDVDEVIIRSLVMQEMARKIIEQEEDRQLFTNQ